MFDVLKRFWPKKTANTGITEKQIAAAHDLLWTTSAEDKALKISAIFRATGLISNTLGKLPLEIYQETTKGRKKAQTHPAYILLRRKASRHITAKNFKSVLTAHALLHGGGYAYISRGPNAEPLALSILSTQYTWPVRENGKLLYVTQMDNGQMYRLDPDDVLHIRGLGWDGLNGWGVIEHATNSINIAFNSAEHQGKFFENSAMPGTVIECPTAMKPDQMNRLRTEWERLYAGAKNSHKTAILTGGMKLNPFTLSAKDAELIETMKFSLTDVANWFNLPPHKLGSDAKSSYNSLEQENQSFLDECLDNWLVTWEEECWDKLLTENQKRAGNYYVEFNRAALVRADLKTRAEYYTKATGGAAWMSINEIRRRENLNDAEGDLDYGKVLQPTNNFDPAKSQAPEEGNNNDD